ncbi:MAG: DUF1269 domain-containing protein [Acetobacteraceae bacterium]|nr:MAG: DUF1269 domain-containing protein [Acetobacteraceae bacterium]
MIGQILSCGGAGHVSDLILLAYRNPTAAFIAGETLATLQKEAGTEPEDIVVVTKSATGRISLNQSINLATGQPLGGGRWGTTIGLLFLDDRKPAASGKGLASQLAEAGLEPSFLRSAVEALAKGGAVVGLRVRLLGAEAVLQRVKALKTVPKVLRTRLSAATEDALYDLQAQIPEQVLNQTAPDGMF